MAVWLVSGIARPWARRAAVVLFAVLLAVAGIRLVRGVPDCGCFGALRVPPSCTVAFDAAALACLFVLGGRSKVARSDGASRPNRFGRLLIAGLLAAGYPAVAAAGLATRLARAHSVSGLYCDDLSFDFGSVRSMDGSSLAHEFVLTNVTHRPIAISSVATSCGCTTASLPARTVQPGASIRLPVKVAWAGRFGPQSAAITLATASGTAESELRLTVSAKLEASAIVWPREILFRDVDPGPSAEQYFEVSQAPDQPAFTVTGIRTSSPSVVVRRVGAPPAGGSIQRGPERFAVSVVAPRYKSDSTGWVAVTTSDGSTHLIDLRVQSRGAIAASPESLLFHADSDPSRPLAVRILLFAGADAKALRCEVAGTGEPRAFEIENVTASVRDGRPAAVVTVRHADPSNAAPQTLRITCGEDSLDVPLVMAAPLEKQPRGPLPRKASLKGDVR